MGIYFKMAKMEILETKKLLSEKNRLKNGDFTCFPGKFPIFCVITLPPGLFYFTLFSKTRFLGLRIKMRVKLLNLHEKYACLLIQTKKFATQAFHIRWKYLKFFELSASLKFRGVF